MGLPRGRGIRIRHAAGRAAAGRASCGASAGSSLAGACGWRMIPLFSECPCFPDLGEPRYRGHSGFAHPAPGNRAYLRHGAAQCASQGPFCLRGVPKGALCFTAAAGSGARLPNSPSGAIASEIDLHASADAGLIPMPMATRVCALALGAGLGLGQLQGSWVV